MKKKNLYGVLKNDNMALTAKNSKTQSIIMVSLIYISL